MDTSPLAPGTTFGGCWLVERQLASGGMGAVYVARDSKTARQVALKVMRPDRVSSSSGELVGRFRREARQLAAVSHPNVVAFLDSGCSDDGTLYIVMELLKGQSLRQAIARDGSME